MTQGIMRIICSSTLPQIIPKSIIAYAITKDSADRERVEKLGRIINHNSFEHYISLVLSKVKSSTHIMGYTPYIDFLLRLIKGIIKGKKIFYSTVSSRITSHICITIM